MSDTPRTDARLMVMEFAGGKHQVVFASVARDLERELADALGRLSKTHRWIPVSEPPKESGRVLIWIAPSINDPRHDVTHWDAAHGFGPKVTHWMPLPEAPK